MEGGKESFTLMNESNDPFSLTIEEKTDRVAKDVLQIPSPENSQPWKIEVSRNVIKVYHLSDRAKLASFPDDLSVMGLGMIAEAIDLSCSTLGLKPEISYFLENRCDKRPWLKAQLKPADTESDRLAGAIYLRHTDRRLYAGGALNDPIFKEAANEAKANQGANLYFTDKYPDEYLDLLKKADQTVMDWPEMRGDLVRWVRFTNKSIRKTRDGMTWRSFLRGPENMIYYLRSRVWWLAACMDLFPSWLMNLEKRVFDDSSELTPLSYNDGAGIGCITTLSKSKQDLVKSGRLSLRIWLLFNLNSYGFQPITNLSSTVYSMRAGGFKLPDNIAPLIKNSYQIMQSVFGFPDNEIPIFCFRTGIAVGKYPDKARSLRKEELIQRKK